MHCKNTRKHFCTPQKRTYNRHSSLENCRLRAAERLHLQLTLAHAHGHYARLQSFEVALSECVAAVDDAKN